MSGRSTRSNTWRFSICVADLGSSDEPQWPHAHASCRTVRSGSATCSNVPPSWPVWPPLALPEEITGVLALGALCNPRAGRSVDLNRTLGFIAVVDIEFNKNAVRGRVGQDLQCQLLGL